MEKVSVGQRVTITCQGITVTGQVISADHETRYHDGQWEVVGYLLEVLGGDGLVHYWKSLIDGGTILIQPELPGRTIEIRIRTPQKELERWEDISTQEWRCETADEAALYCQMLLRRIPQALELRWNWKGSLQGHYIPGSQSHAELVF